MEEERRLCYVALTRAKERLYLTCAGQRMLFGRTSANRPSRFTGEIPSELLEQTGRNFLDRGRDEDWDGFDQTRTAVSTYRSPYSRGEARTAVPTYGGRGGTAGSFTRNGQTASYGQPAPQRPAKPARAPLDTGYTVPQKTSASLPSFQKGDSVEHKAFGKGMVLSIQKMGGDALIEIAFDNVGTKRLMLKSAAQHMHKL
jgi:DNA helicase-2/ATP-dependent DNA helicase PcrA